MSTQHYLLINTQNVVENIIVWDGNPEWSHPSGYTLLPLETTPAMVWRLNEDITPKEYQLVEIMGVGDLGYLWNGTVLTTNDPQPVVKNKNPSA